MARVRRATAADLPALDIVRRQAIEAAFSDAYEREAFADRVARPDRSLPAWIEADDHRVCVAETDTTIVGYGAVSMAAGRLHALYTAPDYRREGVGSDLLSDLEDACLSAGTDRLVATVPTTAVPFFDACGFMGHDRRDDNGIPTVTCRKQLQPDA